jgi:hypothetical protein
MLPEGEEGFDESGTGGCEAEGGNESNDAESRSACRAGGNWSCSADRQASTGCTSGPATNAGRQEAIVRVINKFIVIGACHATRETSASESFPTGCQNGQSGSLCR